MEGPTKTEIDQIFKRLRAIPANKLCFDCNSKNTTWSSVTYGIFICIDCSGIHRSLGVHLTFVRSTQLDSNWTWQQLRQMQLGGNANAAAFFRQHNCTTTDTQLKYKSRAAQLYREKLHNLAVAALRLHGTKLFIDTPHDHDLADERRGEDVEDEEDFFEEHAKKAASSSDEDLSGGALVSNNNSSGINNLSNLNKTENGNSDGGAPNVEAALSGVVSKEGPPRKPTIGQRKPAAKKGLGAKRGGLGAQKVKKDFAEIEREAEMADEMKMKMEEERVAEAARTAEDEAKMAASLRLAYQDISVQQKKQEEKLKKMDPAKAVHAERLGMGLSAKSGVSHSLLTDMGTITQEEPSGFSRTSERNSSSSLNKYEDDFEVIGRYDRYDAKMSGGFGGFSGNGGSGSSSTWENDFERMKLENKNSADDWNKSFEEKPSRGAESSYSSKPKRPENLEPRSSEEALKKFGSAKAISSDMLFGDETNNGPDANLSRFQGSSSISSAEYFGRTEVTPGGTRLQSPDLEDVKESVRQGVSKVAGKLSGMASGVMTQLQEKYGY